MRDRRAGERRGRSKALLPQDSMVLTLTILRTDMTFAIAAPLFGVAPETKPLGISITFSVDLQI